MKKTHPEDRLRHKRIARNRYRRKFRKVRSSTVDNREVITSWRIGNSEFISSPSNLELTSDLVHRACLNFISRIAESIKSNRVYLDFSKLEDVSAPVLVYLYAKFEVFKTKYGEESLSLHKLPRHMYSRSQMQWSGLVDLLRNQSVLVDFDSKDVIPVISDFTTRHDDIVRYVNMKVYDGNMPAEDQWVMGDALSEAFNNVFNHAYPECPEEEKKWWALCNVTVDGQLYLSIYDNGVGIPKSILRPNSWIRKIYSLEHLRAIKKHSRRIRIAMQAGENRRDEEKHGQGSESYRQLVKANPDGELWVLSGKGMYVNYQDQSADIERIFEFNQSLSGTLVQWNIKVGQKNA